MWLIVGLGNPGPEYANQRHNVGFMAVDALVHAYASPSPFKPKFQGLVTAGTLGAEKVVFLKPQTFMNRSGQSVRAAADFYKIPSDRIIVFHDDLDLAFGTVRVKCGGGHGGHNGLRDISAHLGPDYWRVRLGIGHPGDKNRVHAYVLHDFSKDERAAITTLVDIMATEATALLADVGAKTATFTNNLALKRN